MSEDCAWQVYDDSSRLFLGLGLYVAGVISLVLCGLFLSACVRGQVCDERSHLMLVNLCGAALARSLLAGFVMSGTSAVAGRWLFGDFSCQLFGFLHQFLTVYQIEALTHMCIERYVVAKYNKNGWIMTGSRYLLFISLCCMFSTLYSVPQTLGVGRYALDYSCSACTFDLVLPKDSWTRHIVVLILLLQSLKPVMVITAVLQWARDIEIQCYNEKEHGFQLLLTKSATNLSFWTLLCWTPGFLTSSWVILSQLIFGVVAQPPLFLAMLSSLLSEIAPAVIVISILWSNERLRNATVALFGDSHNKTS